MSGVLGAFHELDSTVDVIKSLMKMGVMATINQPIDADTAELIVAEFGHKLKRVAESDVEIGLEVGHARIGRGLADRPAGGFDFQPQRGRGQAGIDA